MDGPAPRRERALHIAFHSPDVPLSCAPNGILNYVRIMSEALLELGHRVTVFNSEFIMHVPGKAERIEHRRWLRLPTVERRLQTALTKVRSAGAHVIEIEESFGWAGQLVGHGVPIVMRLHGPHLFARDFVAASPFRKFDDRRVDAENRAIEKVEAVSSPARGLLDAIIAQTAGPKIGRVILNPIRVPTEQWRPDGADPDQILFVGRFDLRKGANIAIRAFARALKERPSLKLVMVGPDDGLTRDDGSVIHFDEFAATEIQPSARARIQFLGPQSPQRIAELRLGSTLSLTTARCETFSYVIAEAMALGMPVLAARSFGPDELLGSGAGGRLVPVGDVEATAAALLEMLSDPHSLQQMGRSGRDFVATFLNPERIARETLALYETMLQTHLPLAAEELSAATASLFGPHAAPAWSTQCDRSLAGADGGWA